MSDDSETEHIRFGIIRFPVFGGIGNHLWSDVTHCTASLIRPQGGILAEDEGKS